MVDTTIKYPVQNKILTLLLHLHHHRAMRIERVQMLQIRGKIRIPTLLMQQRIPLLIMLNIMVANKLLLSNSKHIINGTNNTTVPNSNNSTVSNKILLNKMKKNLVLVRKKMWMANQLMITKKSLLNQKMFPRTNLNIVEFINFYLLSNIIYKKKAKNMFSFSKFDILLVPL